MCVISLFVQKAGEREIFDHIGGRDLTNLPNLHEHALFQLWRRLLFFYNDSVDGRRLVRYKNSLIHYLLWMFFLFSFNLCYIVTMELLNVPNQYYRKIINIECSEQESILFANHIQKGLR